MYQPSTRLLTILELLQSHDRLSGAELARRLEVDRRTVRRYIMMLQDLGIPVEGTRGTYGGYQLRPGFKLPPLMFNEDEAVAVTLGLLGSRRLGLATTAAAVEGALAKIERVLPLELRARVQALQEAVALDPPRSDAPVAGAVLLDVSAAAAQARTLHIDYCSDVGVKTTRDIDPYGVARWAERWYVVGYCHLRQGLRTFRLDRVVAARPTDQAFERPPDFDCFHYLARSAADVPGRWQVEATLDLPLHEAQRLTPPWRATLEPGTPCGTRFRSQFDELAKPARFFASLGCRVRIHQPPELRDALRRLAGELLDMADTGPSEPRA